MFKQTHINTINHPHVIPKSDRGCIIDTSYVKEASTAAVKACIPGLAREREPHRHPVSLSSVLCTLSFSLLSLLLLLPQLLFLFSKAVAPWPTVRYACVMVTQLWRTKNRAASERAPAYYSYISAAARGFNTTPEQDLKRAYREDFFHYEQEEASVY